jgi:ligand-binding sensor domain-containing protein
MKRYCPDGGNSCIKTPEMSGRPRLNQQGFCINLFSYLFAVFLLSGIGALSAFAQTGEGYRVAGNYQAADGLSHNTVHDIIRDHEGFVWMATPTGLNRFDGRNFITHKHEPGEPETISSSFVWTITEDSDRNFWVGTSGGGLNLFDRTQGVFHSFQFQAGDDESISHDTVTALFEDSGGRLWVGTEGGGLNVLEQFGYRDGAPQASFKRYSETQNGRAGFDGSIVLDIAEDDKGYIWIATYGDGLFRFDPEQERFNRMFEHTDPFVMSVSVDPEQRIWFGTKYGGLYGYDSGTNEFLIEGFGDAEEQEVGTRFIWPLLTDGYVWMGTFGGGLYRADISESNRFSGRRITEIEDSHILSVDKFDDSIWIGTEHSGTWMIAVNNWFEEPEWQFEGGEELAGLISLSFLSDQHGNHWLGTHSGLYFRGSGEEKFVRFEDVSPHLLVQHLAEDNRGRIWMSTNMGLYLHDPAADETELLELTFEGMTISRADRVHHVTGHNGSIWVSSNSGLTRLNDDLSVAVHYGSGDEELSGSNIRKTVAGDDGGLWVLAAHAGVNHISESGEIRHITTDKYAERGMISDRVSDLVFHAGEIWISTLDAGLFRYNRSEDRLERFEMSGSAPSNTIRALYPAGEHTLVLTTMEGIYLFDTLSETSQRLHFHHQGEDQATHRLFETDDGRLLVTKDNGIELLNLDAVEQGTEFQKPVRFTDLQVNYQPLRFMESELLGDGLNLNYNENSLLFEFSLLDFENPALNRYEYSLSGIDEGWIQAGSRNIANYTNLPPGEYLFRVKGSGPAGIASSHVLELPVYIRAPFWETAWFRLLMSVVIISLVYSLYRYRIHHLMKEERVRGTIAKDLHDDVSSTLSSIHFFVNGVEREDTPPEEKERFLRLITASAEEAREKVSDIIWVIHPDDDRWESLVLKCKRFASDVLDSSDIDYSFEVTGSPPARVTLNVKKSAWLIFKELITNVAKHANAASVKIRFRWENRELIVEVKDDGKGFEPEQVSDNGYGLKNIRERVRSLKGSCNLKTRKGSGTEWRLSIPG